MNWYQAVCFEKNKEDIILTFNYFGLEYDKDFYEVQHWNGTTAIFIQINQDGTKDVFKIILDKDLECAKILSRNKCSNCIGSDRYHVIKSADGQPLCFYGLDIWYDVLKFMSSDVCKFPKLGEIKK